MHAELDRYQIEIVKAASDFAKGEFHRELALELDKKSDFPKHIWTKAAGLGFMGIHFDEAFSGGGSGLFENVLLAEAFCRQDSTIGAALMLTGFGSECVLRFGSEGMKQKYLPRIAEGKILCGGAFLEGANDYGLKAQRTTAIREGTEWLLNGKKISAINGKTADIFIVFCHTDEGLGDVCAPSLFLVEQNLEGVVVREDFETLGLRMTSIADIELKNVRVPQEQMVGASGQAHRMMQAYWNESRILLAGIAVGLAQGAFERARDYVKQRGQFGRKLALFQITRHKLAQMAVKIETARRMTYFAARQHTAKTRNDTPSLGSVAKFFAARTAVEVSYESIQLLGGYGYMMEYDVERYYRDAKTIEIICGNSNHLLDDIADSVIGRVR